MKRYILLVLLCSIPFYSFVNAQITITQTDAPVAGESWTEYYDDRVGIHTVGPAGANQNWNYSTNFIAQGSDFVNFILPSSLWPPLNTYFPNSNLAIDVPVDSSVTYIKILANGVFGDGAYAYAPSAPIDSVDYNPDILILPLPFTYNDTRSQASKFELQAFDSTLNATIKFVSYSIAHFHADGYGSLTTPGGTFPNVLRVRNLTQNLDSSFIDTSGTGNFIFINTSGVDTSISYQHLQNGDPVILFTLEVLADDVTVEEAYYTTVLITGLGHVDYPNSQSYIYPNPIVGNEFHIRIEHDNAYVLKIYSIDGREVYSTSVQNLNDLKLQLNLSGGTYTYNLFTRDGKSLESGKFIKAN